MKLCTAPHHYILANPSSDIEGFIKSNSSGVRETDVLLNREENRQGNTKMIIYKRTLSPPDGVISGTVGFIRGTTCGCRFHKLHQPNQF